MEKYLPNPATTKVLAIQVFFNTDGMEFIKWGEKQYLNPGDWVVQNILTGETYVIANKTFVRSYEPVNEHRGQYVKVSPVWAELAKEDGVIPTKEGATPYKAGDMKVYNDPDRMDGWAMSVDSFKLRYIEA